MGDFTDCQQSIRIDYEEMFSLREKYLTSPPKFHITFLFSCQPYYRQWVLHQDSTNPEYERLITAPKIDNVIVLNLEKFISQEPARRTIEETLKDWPVDANWRKNFIDYAMIKAQDEIIRMPRRHNSVFLEFEIVTIHKHVYDEGRALMESSIQYSDDDSMEEEDDDSMEEDDDSSCMVPTVESSIESLEMKKVMDYGTTCSICLEEFPGDGECEGVIMQCKHIFHGDCIKKWLKTSHYCPVCRFEMPTS